MFVTDNYYPLNAFRICADRIDEDVAGRVFSPLRLECIAFRGMGELLVKMDELFDKVGYPQAFQDKRSFDKDRERVNLYRGIPEGELKPTDIVDKCGIVKTYDVIVNSRKNTSWQGTVYNADGTFVADFNGEIALLAAIINNSIPENR